VGPRGFELGLWEALGELCWGRCRQITLEEQLRHPMSLVVSSVTRNNQSMNQSITLGSDLVMVTMLNFAFEDEEDGAVREAGEEREEREDKGSSELPQIGEA
jgi:hypothetical protein